MFKHKVYRGRGDFNGTARGAVLHIYIEGDGKPWRSRRTVALDPTPRKPLMLDLMRQDSNAAIYVGRPCYFATADSACTPIWWTHKRYSAVVIESLNAAINKYSANYHGIRLFGHSGGGTLAMLIAAARDDVFDIVTLAANLDIDTWADFHQYSRLEGSINPALLKPLRADIAQQHYLGELDTVVNSAMLAPTVRRQQNASLKRLPNISHNCCWQGLWQDVLAQFKATDQ